MYVCMNVCMYVCMYMYVYICMYMTGFQSAKSREYGTVLKSHNCCTHPNAPRHILQHTAAYGIRLQIVQSLDSRVLLKDLTFAIQHALQNALQHALHQA